LAARDPRHLRYLVLLLLAVGLLLARGEWQSRLVRAFDSGAGLEIGVDAWIDPPPYTGLPPIYLAKGEQGLISAPIGSVLNVRVHGADHAPGLALGEVNPPRFQGRDGEYSANARLARDAHVRVRAQGHVIGDWHVRITPDAIPTVSFTAT